MKHIKPYNRPAVRIARGETPDVVALSPIPKPDCSSVFGPGIEVHSAASSTDMNASTKGLCSPFLYDTMLCNCTWWPAHDPDFTVEETGQKWRAEMGHGAGHSVNWQVLRFTYAKAAGAGGDAWDKSDPADLNEIYIKDNWADTGTEPSSGNPWESPDIFVRYKDEPVSNFPNAALDYHEGNPIVNSKNFLYARVRNTGHHAIDHVFVSFYAHTLSTNPAWRRVAHGMLRDLPANSVAVVKSVHPWIPSATGPACVRVILDSTQDPVKILGQPPAFGVYDEKAGPQPADVGVQQDNNVAQRNMTAVMVVKGWAPVPIPFRIRPNWPLPGPPPDWHRIELRRPTWPREAEVLLHLPEPPPSARVPFRLRVRQLLEPLVQISLPLATLFAPRLGALRNRILRDIPFAVDDDADARLELALRGQARPLDTHFIEVSQTAATGLLGGLTVAVHIAAPEIVRFVGDVRSQQVHLAFCDAVRGVEDRYKRAFFGLDDARSWGYSVHAECARALC